MPRNGPYVNQPREAQIVALWAFDKEGRYPPQFVAACSEGIRDAWFEYSEELRKLAEQWFSDWDDLKAPDTWDFAVAYHVLTPPLPVGEEAT